MKLGTGVHQHYCAMGEHDHRWECRRRACLLGDVASCIVCRCGRTMVEMPHSGAGSDGNLIYACPQRSDHIGHDSRVVRLEELKRSR